MGFYIGIPLQEKPGQLSVVFTKGRHLVGVFGDMGVSRSFGGMRRFGVVLLSVVCPDNECYTAGCLLNIVDLILGSAWQVLALLKTALLAG